jgi:hypothetical protein
MAGRQKKLIATHTHTRTHMSGERLINSDVDQSLYSACEVLLVCGNGTFIVGDQWRTKEYFFGGGGGSVQLIQLRTEDGQNGDLGAVAP